MQYSGVEKRKLPQPIRSNDLSEPNLVINPFQYPDNPTDELYRENSLDLNRKGSDTVTSVTSGMDHFALTFQGEAR
jgi:hypothetical protein